MTAREQIGRCKCPVCGSTRASLRLSAKQLSYLTCNACNFQGFARSDASDEKLRALLVAEPTPAAEPAPETAPTPEPVRTNVAPAPEPVRTAERPSWGFGSW